MTGSTSGPHEGTIVLAGDRLTVLFQPVLQFAAGERVTVTIGPGLTARDGDESGGVSWWFDIRAGGDAALRELARRTAAVIERNEAEAASAAGPREAPAASPVRASSPSPGMLDQSFLPRGYLPVTVVASDRPDTTGAIYLAPFNNVFPRRGRLLVVDHRGQPLFFRSLPQFAFDFRRQPNGLLTYWTDEGLYEAMDSTCTVVGTYRCGNGYYTDQHELQLLPDGHALLMSYDPEPYPMDTLVEGGRPDAVVMGLVVQELDEAKNVIFEWRSWDHFAITDLVECASHLTDSLVDCVHGNAIERDTDGNLLLSSRHLNEITKIDRATGDILWRMGPNAKHNDFTFLDDAIGFSHQHDIRRLANGHLSLFDNGNCVSTYSRAVEYEVDEAARTVHLVAETRNVPIFTGFMGNRQVHEDGSVTIGWGGAFTNPKITEYHPDGSLALRMALGTATDWSYRALRDPWCTPTFSADESLDFGSIELGDARVRTFAVKNERATPLTINEFVSLDPAFTVVAPDSLVLFPGATGRIAVQFKPTHQSRTSGDLYVRAVVDTELVASVVHLTGLTTEGAVGVADAAPMSFHLHAPVPNPARADAEIRFDLPRRSPVAVEVFDLRGRRVGDLVEGPRPAGSHRVVWKTSGTPAGVYFVRLRAGDFTSVRRIAVAR